MGEGLAADGAETALRGEHRAVVCGAPGLAIRVPFWKGQVASGGPQALANLLQDVATLINR